MIARVRFGQQARLLEVETGQHKDGHPVAGHVIDRRLQVAVSILYALRIKAAVVVLQLLREAGDSLFEVCRVVLADEEMLPSGAVRRYVPGAVGRGGGTLVVGRRHGRKGQHHHRAPEES